MVGEGMEGFSAIVIWIRYWIGTDKLCVGAYAMEKQEKKRTLAGFAGKQVAKDYIHGVSVVPARQTVGQLPQHLLAVAGARDETITSGHSY